MFIASDLHVVLLPALEEQLEVSHHEAEAARLRVFIAAEDHERVTMAGIRQGAGVALAAMQLRVRMDLRRVVPRFPERVGQEERRARVNDFAAAADAVVAAVDVEEILRGGG